MMSNTSVTMSGGKSTSKSKNICGICEGKPSKYCCPRCEVFYCSLDCYKSEKHGQCSEDFYRDCVKEELSAQNADEESKKKMIEILRRMNEDEVEEIENDSDDENYVALHDRVQGLNLNDPEAVWNSLTEDERNEFEALVSQGEMGSIVPQWEPWWEFYRDTELIEDMSEDKSEKEQSHIKLCPSIVKVPKFTDITSAKPSPTISKNIVNCIASYAFVIRYFNGEVEPIEFAAYLLAISANFSSNANFEDMAAAVESVAQNCLQSDLIETDEESLQVMRSDTTNILRGSSRDNNAYYIKASLSHMIDIFNNARKSLKHSKEQTSEKGKVFSKKFPEPGSEYLPKLESNQLKLCVKKLEYYLAFIEMHDTK